jgi:hypothetical protein
MSEHPSQERIYSDDLGWTERWKIQAWNNGRLSHALFSTPVGPSCPIEIVNDEAGAHPPVEQQGALPIERTDEPEKDNRLDASIANLLTAIGRTMADFDRRLAAIERANDERRRELDEELAPYLAKEGDEHVTH